MGSKAHGPWVDCITVMLHVSANGSLQERQSAVGSRQALSFVYVDRTGWSNSELDEFRHKNAIVRQMRACVWFLWRVVDVLASDVFLEVFEIRSKCLL